MPTRRAFGVELSGNLCRCTGYVGLVRAVRRVLDAHRVDAACRSVAHWPRRMTSSSAAGGTSGCVVARRLAENPAVRVLLLEAGADERVDAVRNATIWMSNIGSTRDWQFESEPSPALLGRRPALPMGKVLGGGSSINGLIWARGHKNDFDLWAEQTGDSGWSYASVLELYKRIESWDGPPDPLRRGQNGPGLRDAAARSHPADRQPDASGRHGRHPRGRRSERRRHGRRGRLRHPEYHRQRWQRTRVDGERLPAAGDDAAELDGAAAGRSAAPAIRGHTSRWRRVSSRRRSAPGAGGLRSDSLPRSHQHAEDIDAVRHRR